MKEQKCRFDRELAGAEAMSRSADTLIQERLDLRLEPISNRINGLAYDCEVVTGKHDELRTKVAEVEQSQQKLVKDMKDLKKVRIN